MDMKKNKFRNELLERAIGALPMDEWTDEAKQEIEKRAKEEPLKLALDLIDYLLRELEFQYVQNKWNLVYKGQGVYSLQQKLKRIID